MGWLLNIIGIIAVGLIITWLLYMLLSYLGVTSLAITNMRVTATEEGIELKNKLKKYRFIRWEEIDSGNEQFDPPFNPPVIRLKSGEQIRLDIGDKEILRESFEKHLIPYSPYNYDKNG